MKGLAITVLVLIFVVLLLCIGIVVFAQEPPVPPVVWRGLSIEACDEKLVVITTPVAECKSVKTTQQYSVRNKERIRTIHVRCIN